MFSFVTESSEAKMTDVTELKNEANELFKAGDYENAIALCTKVALLISSTVT